MWDFTYMCVPNNLSLMCDSLPLCGLQDFFVGHEQVLLTSFCLRAFFFINTSSIGTTLCHIAFLAPLATFFCWVLFLQDLCVWTI